MMMKLITLAAMAATASAQMCADSPPSTCRMLCASPVCSTGMCVMRTGSCCDLACIADGASAPSATTSCPDQDGNGVIDVSDVLGVLSAFGGADAQADLDGNGSVDVNDVLSTLSTFGTACSTAPAPPPGTVVGGDGGSDGFNCCGGGAACGFVHCPALGDGQAGCVQPWALPNGLTMETCASVTEPATPACALGGDCGGQVQTSCGTNCPPTCGSPQAMICNLMCFNGFQCPSGGNANWFDPETGTCVAEAACTNDFGNSLPPGIALGRPFTVSARPSPTMSELVEGEW